MEDPEKLVKINQVVSGIKSVLYAQTKRLIMMNAPKSKVSEITSIIPGMGGPTVSEILSNEEMLAINAVIDENKVFETVANLEKLGARDILVLPIERII